MGANKGTSKLAWALSAIALLASLAGLVLLPALKPKVIRAGDNTWTGIGPRGSRVLDLAVSPAYAEDQTLFAAVGLGGIFVSNTGGASWRAANTGLTYGTVRAIAVSPNYRNDRTVFAGTEEAGLFKTTDGGNTWFACNSGLDGTWVEAIAVSSNYAHDGTVFVGIRHDHGGVYKSTDRGQTWVSRNDGLTYRDVRALVVSPSFANDQTLYVALWRPSDEVTGGMFRSTDGADRWYRIRWTAFEVSDLAISPGFENDQVVYAGTEENCIWKSTDRGDTWFRAWQGWCLGELRAVRRITMSPDYAADQTVFIVTEAGVLKSTDVPEVWRPSGSFSGGVAAVAMSPDYSADGSAFVGGSFGVSKTTDEGSSWADADDGLWYPSYTINGVAVSPEYADDGTIVATTWSTAAPLRTTNGGITWHESGAGVEGTSMSSLALSPDFANDQLLLCGTNTGVFQSTDAGDTWQKVSYGLGTLDVQAVAVAASDDLFAAAATGYVYRFTNGATSWRGSRVGGAGTFRCLAASPEYVNDGVLLVGTECTPPSYGTSGGIWISLNRGVSWQRLHAGLPTCANVNALAFSPRFAHDRTVFAGLSERHGRSGGVYKSTDAGTTWHAVNSGIGFDPNVGPDVRALAVSPDFAADQTLYAGTDGFGVFRSTDGGASWTNVGDSLYNPHVRTLSVLPGPEAAIFAGTDGSGIWHYRWTAATPTPTYTNTPTYTPTSTATPTHTATPTSTASPTATATKPSHTLYLPIVIRN